MSEIAFSRLTKPVRCYFEAVASDDSEALANCFSPEAVVIDLHRQIAGRQQIREWAENEALGGRYNIIAWNDDGDAVSLLLTFAPRDEEPFRARYEFQVQGGHIVTASLQYA
jgi:ketosteroid isomerase-like protein